jgi:hypothetical protein
MKPSAIRIERMLEKIEARLVPPPREWLRVIIDEGDDEAEAKEKKEKALAEHVARHPEDVGRTVKDFNWIEWIIVHPIGADGRPRWHTDGGEFEDTDLSEGEFEDTDKDTDKDTDASETLRTGLDQAGSTPELDGKGGPHRNHEPIDLPPPDPGCLARSKPYRPVHQRPARDQRRPTWKKWSGNGHGG